MARMIILYVDIDEIDVINIISLSRFSVGGAAIFTDRSINHHILKVGQIDNIPLVKYILRVCVIVYEMFAKMNRADEHRPCAIIIISAAVIPHDEKDIIPASIIPIWPTDEYAIIDFISGWRKQIRLVIKAPYKDRLNKNLFGIISD